jgi:hypothetical protein
MTWCCSPGWYPPAKWGHCVPGSCTFTTSIFVCAPPRMIRSFQARHLSNIHITESDSLDSQEDEIALGIFYISVTYNLALLGRSVRVPLSPQSLSLSLSLITVSIFKSRCFEVAVWVSIYTEAMIVEFYKKYLSPPLCRVNFCRR